MRDELDLQHLRSHLSDIFLILADARRTEWGLVSRAWLERIPVLGDINEGWSLLSKLLLESLLGVCYQCCDFANLHSNGEQDWLV